MRKLMWFAIGIVLSSVLGIYMFPDADYRFLVAIFASITVLSLILALWFRNLWPCFVLLLGSTLMFAWLLFYESVYLQPIRDLNDQTKSISITLTDYSTPTKYGIRTEGFTIVDGKPYLITAYVNDSELGIKPGDSLSGYFALTNTASDDESKYNFHLGTGTFLVARPRGDTQIMISSELPWYGYPAYLCRVITAILADTFPADTLGFAQALLLGDSSLIDYETDTAFKLSGIRHIIAVSGLHVTILFSLIYTVTGKRRLFSVLLGIPVMILFAAIAGFTPSIMRACIMHSLMAIAMLLEREYDPPTALSFAVIVMLTGNPYVITSASFQLSVGCIVGILLFAEPIQSWLMDEKRWGRYRGRKRKILGKIATSTSISIGATILTMPLCALNFGTVSLVSVLTNLLTLWAITIIFYGIILACVTGSIFVPAGSIIAWLISWAMRYVLMVSKCMAAIPLSAVYTCSIYVVIWLIMVYVLLFAYLLMKRKQPAIFLCCATVSLCVALTASYIEPVIDDVRMTVLDVGQGQSIVLQSEGKTFLVDCGGDSEEKAADAAAAHLLSMGVSRLDGAILTHYDADHAAGMLHLLSRVPADILYLPDCVDSEGMKAEMQTYAEGEVLLVREHLQLSFGDANLLLITTEYGLSNNESGLCILFQRENCDILITGDRNSNGERDLLRQISIPKLEVLIVGHHGSKTSTCEELLEAGRPDIAIISVGDNSYGHPTDEVLRRLEQYGCEIYRTDRDGTVIFRR